MPCMRFGGSEPAVFGCGGRAGLLAAQGCLRTLLPREMASPTAGTPPTEQQVINTYKGLLAEAQQIAGKIAELELEASEHK